MFVDNLESLNRFSVLMEVIEQTSQKSALFHLLFNKVVKLCETIFVTNHEGLSYGKDGRILE